MSNFFGKPGVIQKQARVQTSLEYGLACYWKLDEVTGTRADSVGGCHLTDNNSVGQALGKLGFAGKFDAASNRYLSLVSTPVVQFTKAVTVSAWVNLTSKPGTSNIGIATKLQIGIGTSSEYGLCYSGTSDRFDFRVRIAAGNTIVASNLGAPTLGAWYFLVGQYNGVNLSISGNNGAFNSSSLTGNLNNGACPILIGALCSFNAITENSGSAFDGLIDSVGIWNRVLTSDEISSLYNNGQGYEFL